MYQLPHKYFPALHSMVTVEVIKYFGDHNCVTTKTTKSGCDGACKVAATSQFTGCSKIVIWVLIDEIM